MAEIFSAIVGFVGASTQIKEYVVTPIKNQFSYLFRYDKLIQNLGVQVESLVKQKTYLQRQVDAASQNLQDIDPAVLKSLERVKEIKQGSDNLVCAVPEDQNGTCLNGKCPKPKLRYFQSRQATKLTATVVELLEKLEKFSMAYPAPPMEIETIPPPSGTHEFQSRKEKEEEIMACLRDDTIFMIGVCGMGGVGKTTMANKICRRASEEKVFDEIVKAVVSHPADLGKIQKEIAEYLHLELKQETLSIRAGLLHTRLMSTKTVLIVLDDVWQSLNLEQIGIPSQNIHRGCKIILTTRNRHVGVEMNSSKIFQLEVLHDKEAWTLFQEKAGSVVDQPGLRELAEDVAAECKGLPLGLVTVGSALRGVVDICEWRNALEQLKSCSVGFTEMEVNVFPILEWSFNRLNGCEGPCFLYCCLYPEDSKIEREELINLFILAELIPRRKNRESEHDHGHTILNKLVKACLLEETQNFRKRECIKMHDLIRDMALRITGRNSTREMKGDVPRFLVSGIVEESEWTEDLNAVSIARPLFYKGSLEIPSDMSPKCKNLSTLLFKAVQIERIPDSFFRDMDGLKVLVLRRCRHLKELPNSVSNLVNLTALLLRGCREIKSVPPLGELKKLRELDLSYTRMDDIPQGLELLVNLERLNMGGTRLKKTIPKGTFSRLIRLEHLILPKLVRISDPKVLKQLQVFRGCLSWMDVDNEFMTSPCWPQHYDICVAEEETLSVNCRDFVDPDFYYYDRNKLEFERCNFKKGLDVNLLPKDIKRLRLSECFGFSDGNLRNLIRRSKDLVHLSILDSEEVEFVVNFSSPLYDDNELVVLPNLQQLWLSNLPNLVGLINWGRQQQQQLIPPPPRTFSSLTELHISGCHRLKKLFTVQLLSQQNTLQNLESLHISYCEQLEEMIAANDNDEGMGEEVVIHPSSSSSSSSTVRLPKLSTLWINNLPQLENKNCKAISIISDSIRSITVYRCPMLKRMPVSVYIPINAGNGQTSSSSAPPPNTLPEICGSKKWWESLEWDHYPPNSKDALLPFFKPSTYY